MLFLFSNTSTSVFGVVLVVVLCTFFFFFDDSELLLKETKRQILWTVVGGYLLASLSRSCFRWYHRPLVGPTHLNKPFYKRGQPVKEQRKEQRKLLRGRHGLKKYFFYPPNRKRRTGLVLEVAPKAHDNSDNTSRTSSSSSTNSSKNHNQQQRMTTTSHSTNSPGSPNANQKYNDPRNHTSELRQSLTGISSTLKVAASALVGGITTLDHIYSEQIHKQQSPVSKNKDSMSKLSSGDSDSRSKDASVNGATSNNSNTINNKLDTPVDPPVLVYHESARSIVFRDHMRRAVKKEQEQDGLSTSSTAKRTVTTAYVTELMDSNRDQVDYQPPDDMIASKNRSNNNNNNEEKDGDDDTNSQHDQSHSADDVGGSQFSPLTSSDRRISNAFQPNITPLPALALGANDELEALMKSPTGQNGDVDPNWTKAEREVVEMLANQQAVVKTIQNVEWTPFLHRFQIPHQGRIHVNYPTEHDDVPPEAKHPFNSFVTSCSLLPPFGQKMRSYGAPSKFTSGVVFALPKKHFDSHTGDVISEDDAARITKTWSWPPGYSAKTEFNIDGRGNLINGREEALVSLSELRQLNMDYLTKEDHMIAGRLVKGGLKTVPYNEIYLRVGGLGRIVNGKDVATGDPHVDDEAGNGRSLERGLGLPVALFVRTATYGHLISLLRTRARLVHVLGENRIKNMPLLLITPEDGVRVLTDKLQAALLKDASQRLNPFQNPTIAHRTTVNATGANELEQKLEELIDLDDSIRRMLTPEECARLAGGFGATDDSVATILKEAMLHDKKFQQEHNNDGSVDQREGHMLQDVVNEGLAAAVRSGDYYTSRQLLILYSLVAASANDEDDTTEESKSANENQSAEAKLLKDTTPVSELKESMNTLSTNLSPPPPPPLDTDRLRSATNSDGLLAVLGAAQVLKAMRDGGAKRRTDEVILALDE